MTPGGALRPRYRRLLVAAHVPLLLVPGVLAVVLDGGPGRPGPATIAVAAAAATAVCALQVRHAVAVAGDLRPAAWPATLGLLAALVYLPLWWLPSSWIVTQFALVASLVLLLPRRAALPLAVLLVVGSEAVLTVQALREGAPPLAVTAWSAVYNLAIAAFGPVVLVAATHLVRVLDDLSAARAELAEAAVRQERLRISRDLHDVLGQSLAAVSLKGELALRLLDTDRTAATAELESLVGVARAALRDVGTVAFDRNPTSVRDELAAAGRLLDAAGIATTVDVTLPAGAAVPRVQDDALGWVLREGVTNVLRHSAATRVEIRAGQRDGRIHLEIVNDGAPADGADGGGTGLDGLGARLAPLGGVLSAGRAGDGRFRLAVDLPEELP